MDAPGSNNQSNRWQYYVNRASKIDCWNGPWSSAFKYSTDWLYFIPIQGIKKARKNKAKYNTQPKIRLLRGREECYENKKKKKCFSCKAALLILIHCIFPRIQDLFCSKLNIFRHANKKQFFVQIILFFSLINSISEECYRLQCILALFDCVFPALLNIP